MSEIPQKRLNDSEIMDADLSKKKKDVALDCESLSDIDLSVDLEYSETNENFVNEQIKSNQNESFEEENLKEKTKVAMFNKANEIVKIQDSSIHKETMESQGKTKEFSNQAEGCILEDKSDTDSIDIEHSDKEILSSEDENDIDDDDYVESKDQEEFVPADEDEERLLLFGYTTEQLMLWRDLDDIMISHNYEIDPSSAPIPKNQGNHYLNYSFGSEDDIIEQ